MSNDNVDKEILILDDDAVFRRLVRSLLESQGYKVAEAGNGLDGLHHLASHVPDLVVCDIEMPLLNGIEFVEEVSQQYPSLPMIVVSGTDKMSVVAKTLKFGIKDFVTKPIANPAHLLKTVSSTLKEAENNAVVRRDFASQWFQLSDQGELPEEQELHWHLQYLDQNPAISRELLQALLPDKHSSQGVWHCYFRTLQSLDTMPLIYDYTWTMNGQFLFYIVDTESTQQLGVPTTLLIRALFNDYIRNPNDQLFHLDRLVKNIEKGIQCANCAEPIKGIFGLVDFPNQEISIMSAGLDGTMANVNHTSTLVANDLLGSSTSSQVMRYPIVGEGDNTLKLTGLSHTNCQVVIQKR